MMLIHHPETLHAGVSDLGGKGAALARLTRAGFRVPRFFVIDTRAFAPETERKAAHAAIHEAVAGLAAGALAVRSSGREEDGGAHSHAGQFLSLLDIAAPDVPAAALKVWNSGLTASLRAYRASKGLEPDGGAPAVVVQAMVKARAAGVAFSADPVSGRRDRIVISAVAGLGDRLVGGEVDGDDYALDKASGAVLSAPGQGVLSPADCAALADLVLRVEAHFGCPQDIEWAFEGETLFLLQARPITTALRAAPVPDTAETIFDNSNIVESYPGLVSPLTYSFAQYVYARVYRMFVRIVGVREDVVRAHAATFENMLGRVDGRVYYNLVNWYRALALLPGFSLNRAHMETMMGVDEPLPRAIADAIGPPPATGFFARGMAWAGVVRTGGLLAFEALRLKHTMRGFYRRLDSALERPAAELESLPLTALAAEYRRIEAELLDRWDAPLINDFLCMMVFGASRKILEKWAGPDALTLHNDVMIGQGDIVSAEPARRIRRMGDIARGDSAVIAALKAGDQAAIMAHAALRSDIEAYIAKFGDRCTEELKLESITLDEDPRALYASIAAAAEVAPRAEVVGDDPMARLAALFGRRRIRGALTLWSVRAAKALVSNRENLRFERTRIFGRARRLLLAMGRQFHALGHLDDARDIFFLTHQDVLGAVEGFGAGVDLRSLAALRKGEMAAAATRPDPAPRLVVRGAAITGLGALRTAAPPVAATGLSRKGSGCSAGTVIATARVIRDPRTEGLERGEILVARHTDPGWIAVFTNASAIVVERGSLLSHSAIVARELGIPCVVGIRDATQWLASGQRIEVNGATGEVRKIDG